MCGIAGFIDQTKDKQVLESMTCALERRGPDDSGIYFQQGVGLGHRRLSIIDLSAAGHQPMQFEHLTMVFNGEIYNYQEVQQELRNKGYSFESHSDSEVVLKAFHCWGPECVVRFIGMFAIAIHDGKSGALTLIRDRAGVKPLYYYFKEGRIAFASEVRAFKTFLSPEERNDIDTDALSDFLSVGYITNGRSIIRSVRKLPQGHYLVYHQGKIEVKKYWQVSFRVNESWKTRSENDLLDELEDLVVSSFKYRMVADVPVGVFLSAGVDSSLVTAVLNKHYGSLRTFTIGFSEAGYDESADARRIAEFLGTEHTERMLGSDQAFDILERFYDIYDEPHGDNSCVPTAFVSELARDHGAKVVLSADAGDELFGGYVRYTEYLNRWEQVRNKGRIGKAVFAAAGAVTPKPGAYRFNRFTDILEKKDFIHFYQTIIRSSAVRELKEVFPKYREPLTAAQEGEWLNQMCEWDFNHYMADDILVKVDRATMYHSIEGREPFLDHRLVEFAAQLPLEYKIRNGQTKYILKKLLGRYLPTELYDLPKRGFGAPIQQWIKEYYKQHLKEVFADNRNPYLDKRAVNAMIDRYQQGQKVNLVLLWYLYSFTRWYNQWIAS